jgi:hypothetical protein
MKIDLEGRKTWTGFSGFEMSVCSCEHCNVRPDLMKAREFLDQMSDFLLLKQFSAPWNSYIRNKARQAICIQF